MARTLDFTDHRRDLGDNRYIYAVVSRRARGLSIGVNLNPDKVCNFDCPYCQVDRTVPGGDARIDVDQLEAELARLLAWVADGSLWEHAPFDTVAPALRRVADIAFAGDGEPTTPPEFPEAAARVRGLLSRSGLTVPLRLLTNATMLHRERVRDALPAFDEVWGKLDAGTEAWFARVDGTRFPFSRVLANLAETAARRPITLQSMFCSLDGEGPSDAELDAWAARVRTIAAAGTVAEVQIYTVARRPADAGVAALPLERLEAARARIPELRAFVYGPA